MEVIEIDRKFVAIFVALMAGVMLATPIVGLVQAGKGQEKLSIFLQLGPPGINADPGETWNSPPDAVPPNVVHMRNVGWGVDSTGFMIVVDEGGVNEETFDDEDITYSCSYDLNLFINKAPYLSATIKVREMWDLGERGYIEILAVEYLYDLNSVTPEGYHGAGSFVGHGVINGQNIKLSGEAGAMPPIPPFREGIVMGWPT